MNRRQQAESVPWRQDAYGFWSELSQVAKNLPEIDASTAGDGPAPPTQMGRRSAMGILAASAALAGLPSCRRPDIELRPYSKMPENVVPGMSLFYATTLTRGGSAVPVLVETHEGRPTKVEGHPRYTPTQGASDAIDQAAILQLYDPDRLSQVRRDGITSSWNEFNEFAGQHFAELLKNKGAGLRILSNATPSPALRLLRRHMRQAAPEAKWHAYEPLSFGHAEQAARQLFGKSLRARCDFRQPDVIVSLDADFLGAADRDAIANSRAFAERRISDENGRGMNRLYVLEPMLTLTGSMADHRLPLAANALPDFALALAEELRLFEPDGGWEAESVAGFAQLVQEKRNPSTVAAAWASEIVADLQAHRGRSLVIAGSRQPPLVHALAQLMNLSLGNVPKGVKYVEVVDEDTDTVESLAEDVTAGQVNTLVVLAGNPAYDAPADLELADWLPTIPNTIRLGLYEDETAQLCQWRLPAAHTFESWGDAETVDGDYLPVQPMIAPLYDGRSSLTVLAKLLRYETDQEYEIVQRAFTEQRQSLPNAPTFDRWVHDGIAQRQRQTFEPKLTTRVASGLRDLLQMHQARPVAADQLEICFQADASVFDGQFANLSWLQEVPDPITKLTWDNAALLSSQTASDLSVATGDVVRLTLEGRSVEAPVFVQPGHVDHSITLPLGYGRTQAGRVGTSVGFNAYPLRTSRHLAVASGVELEPLGKRHQFALAQQYDRLDDRDIAREQTIEEFTQRAAGAEHSASHDSDLGHTKGHADGHEAHGEAAPLIEPPKLDGKHQWGMVIDLSKCIGCSACMVACQSENNIPVVGKDEVARGRAMHWIRVDRYYRGPEPSPEVIHEPVACVHCENAPCETVCPVNAAVHSPEGLNLQVYNRCVGTRYCSNNCPYKVRRFNWFDYNKRQLDQLRLGPLGDSGMAETLKMQKNPDVTVRMRGVMEKCTYCVQRIERGKAGAKLASPGAPDYTLADGQVVPACAQACPADAIVFGDLTDEASRVSQQKRDPRRFELLGELGTKPRTSYLTRLRNPNPRMAALGGEKDDGA